MVVKHYLNWEEVDYTWGMLNMLWEDVSITREVNDVIKKSGGLMSDYIKGNPWNKLQKEIGIEKVKKFIKIFCRVNNLDYEKVIEPKENIKISVGQMEKVFNDVLKIDVKV
jgi:hypothetical protein